MKKQRFEIIGHSIDYYIGTKFIGSRRVEDNEAEGRECGYGGRERFTTPEDIKLDNRKIIKAGTHITTELNQINGKVLNRPAMYNKKEDKNGN